MQKKHDFLEVGKIVGGIRQPAGEARRISMNLEEVWEYSE
jgi:hypothetical protein